MSAIGVKSRFSALDRRRPRAAVVEPRADQRAFRVRGAFRRRRHAAVGDARAGDPPPVEREAEGAHHGGNVLVDPLGDLEGAIGLVGGKARRDDGADVFALAAILFAVGDEEVLERQDARRPPC